MSLQFFARCPRIAPGTGLRGLKEREHIGPVSRFQEVAERLRNETESRRLDKNPLSRLEVGTFPLDARQKSVLRGFPISARRPFLCMRTSPPAHGVPRLGSPVRRPVFGFPNSASSAWNPPVGPYGSDASCGIRPIGHTVFRAPPPCGKFPRNADDFVPVCRAPRGSERRPAAPAANTHLSRQPQLHSNHCTPQPPHPDKQHRFPYLQPSCPENRPKPPPPLPRHPPPPSQPGPARDLPPF